jgi:glycosyltransferase involved in cell wall biosynthesis
MKVLLSAYACEPDHGSEDGVGWNFARQAARFHEVWVVTLGDHRPAIERTLSEHPLPSAHFVYLDLPRWRKIRRMGWLGDHISYYAWQIAAYFVARKLHRELRFDLAHHVTLVCYWRPSFLALLPVPFVWGPVGGAESAPRAFFSSFSLRGKVNEIVRDVGRKIGEFDPIVRRTARKPKLGLATTEETAKRMRMLGCRSVSIYSEAGLPQEEICRLSSIPFCQGGPFRLLSLGRLVHWKGFELGLRAFARVHSRLPEAEYWIIGEGPERKRLEGLARRLGVGQKVTFWGYLPRSQVLEKLAECHALAHPSLHDSGGWVCLEAMAAGRPVICLDLGGPALQVTDETGIKVPAISPDQAVSGLEQALFRLATDPALRARLGSAARQRVKDHFAWDEKGEFLATVYEGVVREERSLAC